MNSNDKHVISKLFDDYLRMYAVDESYGQIWCMGIRRFSCLIAPLLVRRLGISHY